MGDVAAVYEYGDGEGTGLYGEGVGCGGPVGGVVEGDIGGELGN